MSDSARDEATAGAAGAIAVATAAEFAELTPEQAADPKIRVRLRQIERRRIELEIMAERDGRRGVSGPRQPRPTWGPCTRCGHVWLGYPAKHPPLHCSRCCSRYWQEEPRHQSRARTPADAPHPNWKRRRERPGLAITESRLLAPPPQSLTAQSALPPPPRAISSLLVPPPLLPPELPRPLAAELRWAIAQEIQPERATSARVTHIDEGVNDDDIRSGDALRDDAAGAEGATALPDGPVQPPALGTGAKASAASVADADADAADVIDPRATVTDEERALLTRLGDGEDPER